jgi:type IV secretion system protein TrbL
VKQKLVFRKRVLPIVPGLCLLCLLGLPAIAAAQQTTVGTTFQQIAQAANGWIPAIFSAATNLFFLLAALDFAWGAPSFFRENDFMGLFLSLMKKLLVASFFYAVLINGQVWIPAIVNSFAQIGSNVTGLPVALNPSDILASGLQICSTLIDTVRGANLFLNPGAS